MKEDVEPKEVWKAFSDYAFKIEGQVTVRRVIGKLIRWVLLLLIPMYVFVAIIASNRDTFIDTFLEWFVRHLKKFENSGKIAEQEKMWKNLKD
jgi:hypothetical protein